MKKKKHFNEIMIIDCFMLDVYILESLKFKYT